MCSKYITDKVRENAEYIVNLRRYFHRYPEISAKEYRTAEKIEEELDKLGIAHERVGETGVYAEIDGAAEGDKTIFLRADIDALAVNEEHESPYKSEVSGVSHACGHDAHTASLLGAAKVLSENRRLFGGKVKLAFQQGEEFGIGAKIFIGGGYLDGADRSFGIHVASYVDVGKVIAASGANNASVDYFKITVQGKSAHITTPEQGADALGAAAQIATSLQTLKARTVSATESLLIGVGKLTAGTAYNVVAEQAEIEGTVRAFSAQPRKAIQKAIDSLSAALAATYGCTAKTVWKDFTSPLINDDKSTEEVRTVASELFGAENVIRTRVPSLGGDDFAEYILKVPGAYAFMGSRNEKIPETCAAHHSNNFDIDERALINSAALYAAYAVNYLNNNV